MTTKYLIGAFRDSQHENAAIDELRQAGFKGNEVEVVDHSKDWEAKESVEQALRSRGVPEADAKFFEKEFRSGHNLVTVRANGRDAEAQTILRRHDALFGPTATTAQATAPNAKVPNATAPNAAARMPAEGANKMTLKEEELVAGKERVQAGEVVIKKNVKTEQQTVNVPITKEEVSIERRPVAGEPPATEPIQEGQEIHVPVTEERATVGKRNVVKEEIEVGKKPMTETKTVSGTVRKEEAKVERKGDADVAKTNPRSDRR